MKRWMMGITVSLLLMNSWSTTAYASLTTTHEEEAQTELALTASALGTFDRKIREGESALQLMDQLKINAPTLRAQIEGWIAKSKQLRPEFANFVLNHLDAPPASFFDRNTIAGMDWFTENKQWDKDSWSFDDQIQSWYATYREIETQFPIVTRKEIPFQDL
ncbi:MAG: hypothetical protein ACRC5C_12465, partial [Bacilli bacterium]